MFLFKRQVKKSDVENLLRKYSLEANLKQNENSSQSNNKFFDSTNTLTNENNSNGSVSTVVPLSHSNEIPLLCNLNLTHFETTSCEEYEIVQNFFIKLLREIKRERDQHQLANQVIDENTSSSSSSKGNKSKLIMGSKLRAKSPKSNASNIIQENNNNLSAPISTGINSINSNMFLNSAASMSSPSQSVNNPLTDLVNSALNSSNSAQTQNVDPETANNSGGKEITGTSSVSKKNSSKFPFFTKILNKS
jgi:hypothetical protein